MQAERVLPVLHHEHDLHIWMRVDNWYWRKADSLDYGILSLIQENLRFSIKAAYDNIMWYSKNDISDAEFQIINLSCELRLKKCYEDVRDKFDNFLWQIKISDSRQSQLVTKTLSLKNCHIQNWGCLGLN